MKSNGAFGFVSDPYFEHAGQSPAALFTVDLATEETLFEFDLGKVIIETKELTNKETLVEFMKDPR